LEIFNTIFVRFLFILSHRQIHPGEGGGKGVHAGEARRVYAADPSAGRGQVDFGYALAKVSGVLRKVGVFVMGDLGAGTLDL
jgi:hypothetical protein